MPVSICHCNRLWAHRSRHSSYRSEIHTTRSVHLDGLAFQFSAHSVKWFRRYSHIFVPTTRFEHWSLSHSNRVLSVLFSTSRRRFTSSIPSPSFVTIRRLLHSTQHFFPVDHITTQNNFPSYLTNHSSNPSEIANAT